MKLTSYPGTVRQLIVTGLGRDAPTVIITNDTQIKTKALIGHYARRMTIEQRLAEIIQAFCADALSSAVNLNVDLDVVLYLFRPRPSPPPSGSACPATTPTPPPTPSSAASWTSPAKSSATAPGSPSRSTAAPTHPSSATPPCPVTPPSPGGADASSTSSPPDPRAEVPVRKPALEGQQAGGGAAGDGVAVGRGQADRVDALDRVV